MEKNIGQKLKTLALVIMAITMTLSIVGGIIFIALKSWVTGIIVLIVGCLSSVITYYLMYGFGELICKTTEIAENTKKLTINNVNMGTIQNSNNEVEENIVEKRKVAQNIVGSPIEVITEENLPNADECPYCFAKIGPQDKTCPNCGWKLK